MAWFEGRTANGIKLRVSKLERLERHTVIDPIPALFVCVLRLEFGSGSWLTSRKTLSLMPGYQWLKGSVPPPVGIAGQVTLAV